MTRKEEIEIILQKLLMRAIPNIAASAELKDIKKYCTKAKEIVVEMEKYLEELDAIYAAEQANRENGSKVS